ncbi:MFS transporter [Pusillimonas sp. TS35]|uniref:MFS transporter n=1 Tax=Paracandidimonas lactea TaxID=2895524 RepID=UPI001368299D|nr:MFS transporter [Paracandidimonas lactea]MYN14791.1 MFS transporter [Pusillimonas sp. TS35]
MKTGIYGTLGITLAIQALVSAASLTVPVLAPALAPVFDVPGESVGIYVAILYVGAMVGSLSAGGWVARHGAIRVSQAGLLFSALGLMLTLFASPVLALFGAFLAGLGYGPITPASSHLLARTTPDDRMGFVFSIKQTGVPLGGVVAGLIAPKLSESWGWQAAILTIAVACLLCMAIAQIIRKALDYDRGSVGRSGLASLKQSFRLILMQPAIRLLAISSLMFSAVQVSLSTYLVTYLHDSLGYTLIAAGFLTSVTLVAGVGGRLLWGWCADRWLGSVMMLVWLAVMMTAASWMLATFDAYVPQWLLLLVLIVFGASGIGWNGVYLAEVARQAPDGQIGLATGGTLAATFFGVVIGPPAFGAVASMTESYRASFIVLVVPALLIGLVLLRNRDRFDLTRIRHPRQRNAL